MSDNEKDIVEEQGARRQFLVKAGAIGALAALGTLSSVVPTHAESASSSENLADDIVEDVCGTYV